VLEISYEINQLTLMGTQVLFAASIRNRLAPSRVLCRLLHQGFSFILDGCKRKNLRMPKETLRRMILRSLERFAEFFELVEHKSVSDIPHKREYQVRATGLLDALLQFWNRSPWSVPGRFSTLKITSNAHSQALFEYLLKEMNKKAFAAKMNLYDEKYGEFAALFCKIPPEEYDNVIEYLSLLQTLENDFPGILSEPIEEEKESELNDFISGIELLEKMDEYRELLKVYVDIPAPQRSEALRLLTAVDKIIAEKKID
jgi:hypothetical protein